MKILFDELNKPFSSISIANSINKFKPSYTNTVNAVIRRSHNNVTQSIFFENVAQLMPNFKMTRRGPFSGVKYKQGIVQDPNRKISDCWSAVGVSIVRLKNILSQQRSIQRNRLIADISDALKGKIISDLKQIFNTLIPVCMGKATNGRVAASNVLFSVLPEIALPVDTAMWKKLFETIDYGDIIETMATEIIEWESQTGNKLDICDPSGNSTLPAIYNVMAMKARP